MVEISFKGKLRVGNSKGVIVVTVPAQYIKDGILWTGEECSITIDTLEPAGTIRDPISIITKRGK